MKSKVTNPLLQNNFNIDAIANYLASFISGDEFINNLDVKKSTKLNKVEISDTLKIQGLIDCKIN